MTAPLGDDVPDDVPDPKEDAEQLYRSFSDEVDERCAVCDSEATASFRGTDYCDQHFQERVAREGIGT